MVHGQPYEGLQKISRYTDSNYSSLKFKKKFGRNCFFVGGGGGGGGGVCI
jgi:hypothetical protein